MQWKHTALLGCFPSLANVCNQVICMNTTHKSSLPITCQALPAGAGSEVAGAAGCHLPERPPPRQSPTSHSIASFSSASSPYVRTFAELTGLAEGRLGEMREQLRTEAASARAMGIARDAQRRRACQAGSTAAVAGASGPSSPASPPEAALAERPRHQSGAERPNPEIGGTGNSRSTASPSVMPPVPPTTLPSSGAGAAHRVPCGDSIPRAFAAAQSELSAFARRLASL